ncbi:MAG: transcription initiation factor IIB family protein [Candidatus Hermodarchaeota archaeon]|jgi:transcription initiation factor TFIIB
MTNNYRELIKIKNVEQDNLPSGECCANPCIEERDGNKVCLNCGIIMERTYVGNERRAYTIEEIQSRRRTEPRWRDFGPRTMLPTTKTDSKGKSIGPKEQALFSRLSKIQNSLISSIERNFWEAKPKLKMLTSKLNIPEYISETAWKIYTIVAKKKLTMGRSINGFIAGSLYAAIRVHDFPRLLDEVCEASLTPRRTVHRSLAMIIREVLPQLGLRYSPITAEILIFRFGNELDLPMKVQKTAIDLLRKASENGLKRTGKDPKGLAAACVYIAAKDGAIRKTQSLVADIAKITEVTLRSRAKQIKSKLS